MPWELFEHAAPKYAEWYATRRGRRIDQAECGLLARLLRYFPAARTALEIGCGTGHFTHWLTSRAMKGVGMDRSPAMLREMRRRFPDVPAILAEAHCLPFGGAAVDLVVYVTTLEFLDQPARALGEGVRIARQGVILLVLNRWSLGGLSRRWGPQAHQPLLGQAQDFSLATLQRIVKESAERRFREMHWSSVIFPGCPWGVRAPIPLGDVIGLAAVLTRSLSEKH